MSVLSRDLNRDFDFSYKICRFRTQTPKLPPTSCSCLCYSSMILMAESCEKILKASSASETTIQTAHYSEMSTLKFTTTTLNKHTF